MKPIDWDIRREGRRWSHEEFDQRIYQAPEKIEYVDGIFASERERLNVLGMLLGESRHRQGDPIRKARRLESCSRRPGEEARLLEPAVIGELI